jgi:hypothetical protein
MITAEQKRQLMKNYSDEPIFVLGLMMKCAAGLVIVAGLALIGVQSNGDTAFPPMLAQHTVLMLSPGNALAPTAVEPSSKEFRSDE